ncbi:tRNA (N6-threonylcarbamoyladenosine(37)-N6)-methyltransferase TrmO [Thermodesulfobacteriota bacterium]
MSVHFSPIGTVHTTAKNLPRHWTVSDVEGTLEIKPEYTEGLTNIEPGQQIVVLFHFHKSPPFDRGLLKQTPPRHKRTKGVFSICSPRRPNAIGLSVVRVIFINDNLIRVHGLDMIDGTPILDIKPHIVGTN